MVLEIATALSGLALTVVLVTWSLFAGVRQSSMACTAERHGGRSLPSEFHTPSVSQRPVERAQWCHLTTGLPERIVSRPCREKQPCPETQAGLSLLG